MEIDTTNDSKFKMRSHILLGEPESPAMIRFLVRHGIVKNEKQAMVVIFSLIGVLVIASIFLFARTFSAPTPSTPPANRPVFPQKK